MHYSNRLKRVRRNVSPPPLLVNYGKYPKNPSIFAMMGKYTSVTSYKIGICQIQKRVKRIPLT